MSEDFFTVEQVAERLSLHPKTVLRYIHDGRLRGTRIGKAYRIMRADLNAFAGAGAGTSGPAVQVTSVAELAGISSAASQRLATLLNAAVMGAKASARPVHVTTAFNPVDESLKIVLIGSPGDVATLLQFIDLQIEQGG